jgi:hypothetical protein
VSATAAPTPPPTEPTAAAAQKESLPTSGKDFLNRIRTGDLGSLRVLVLLAIVWAIFQSQESRFLSSTNIVNLSLQITASCWCCSSARSTCRSAPCRACAPRSSRC